MEKPIVLVIMDGVGKGDGGSGDAVAVANTPTLDTLLEKCPHTYLKAHGTAVGLPSDEDMGNSEVGHNALGCGQVYSQGAKLVGESIENGSLYASATWKELVANAEGKAMHFIGLLSDGNVHSNIHHLIALLKQAKAEGVKKAYCHILLDGRDVPATSALEYVAMLEDVLAELSGEGFDYAIASGGGRMQVTMDRYEANWGMVEKGWRTHVQGQGRMFPSLRRPSRPTVQRPAVSTRTCPHLWLPVRVNPLPRSQTATPLSCSTSAATVRRKFPSHSTARISISLTAAITPASSLPVCCSTTQT